MVKAKVSEIFESVQGEGIYLGEQQIFVRFLGCNLDCRFCDTPLTAFTEFNAETLFEHIQRYSRVTKTISFTGGEPLVHARFLQEILPLTYANRFKNYLETNGTLPEALESVIKHVHTVAMDIKLPSSTGLQPFWDEHKRFIDIARRTDFFIKTIITETTTESDIHDMIAMLQETNSTPVVVLQPNSNDDPERLKNKLAYFRDLCTDAGLPTCVIPQMHKILGVR